MKKIYLLIIIESILIINSFSQTYREAYDNYELGLGGGKGQGDSYYANVSTALSGDGIYMETYINMFKATKDKKYLDKFIIHAKRVLERRDDYITLLPFGQLEGFPASFYDSNNNYVCQVDGVSQIDQNSKAWSCVKLIGDVNNPNCQYDDKEILHSGGFLFPMAEFVYLMMTDADFTAHQYDEVPEEAQMSSITIFNPYNTVGEYYEFAAFLENKIKETITYQECTWVKIDNNNNQVNACTTPSNNQVCGTAPIIVACEDGPGAYVKIEDGGCNGTTNLELNKQCNFGKALAFMYEIASLQGDQSTADLCHCHITDLTMQIKDWLQINTNNNSYWWEDYNCEENIGHAALVMTFADVCYELQITNAYNTNLQLFTLSDMQKFANTFKNNIIIDPLVYEDNVYGANNSSTCSGDGNTTPNGDLTGGYTFLCKYDPVIYQMISDYWSEGSIYNTHGDLGSLSELTLYENLFNPIAVQRYTYSNPQRVGVASGDFDNDGQQEFVSLNNHCCGNAFDIYSVDNSTNAINHIADGYTLTSGSTWANGVGAGKIDPTFGGDIVAAVYNPYNNVQLAKKSGSDIVPYNSNLSWYLNFLSGDYPVGIAVGDILSSYSGNEVVVLSQQGCLNVFNYGYSITQAVWTPCGEFPTGAVGVAIGHFDSQTDNGVAVISNSTTSPSLTIKCYNSGHNYSLSLSAGVTMDGISKGDFDGDGIDEIMVHQSSDGYFVLYKIKSGTLQEAGREAFPLDQQNGVICSTHFLSIPQTDALITLRNYDGQITIFNMGGLCQSLTLDNITIDDNTSINNLYSYVNNTYTLDYHASNTLVAENVTISDGSPQSWAVGYPSPVDFIAGKEVDLLPGFTASAGSIFDAYIDPSIFCSNHALMGVRKNPNPPPPPIVKKYLPYPDALLYPSPTEGVFTVKVNSNENKNFNFVLADFTGRIISEDNVHSGENTLDKSFLEGGLYLWQVYLDNAIIGKGKLIIAKNGQTKNKNLVIKSWKIY